MDRLRDHFLDDARRRAAGTPVRGIRGEVFEIHAPVGSVPQPVFHARDPAERLAIQQLPQARARYPELLQPRAQHLEMFHRNGSVLRNHILLLSHVGPPEQLRSFKSFHGRVNERPIPRPDGEAAQDPLPRMASADREGLRARMPVQPGDE